MSIWASFLRKPMETLGNSLSSTSRLALRQSRLVVACPAATSRKLFGLCSFFQAKLSAKCHSKAIKPRPRSILALRHFILLPFASLAIDPPNLRSAFSLSLLYIFSFSLWCSEATPSCRTFGTPSFSRSLLRSHFNFVLRHFDLRLMTCTRFVPLVIHLQRYVPSLVAP